MPRDGIGHAYAQRRAAKETKLNVKFNGDYRNMFTVVEDSSADDFGNIFKTELEPIMGDKF